MTFKRFGPQDVMVNTIVTKPDVNFMVHNGVVYYQLEEAADGDFSNKIKHVPSGHISLHELNINRPEDSLIFPFIEKSSTRYAWKTISTTTFDDNFQFLYGDTLADEYPDSGSISRIYIPSGHEFNSEENGKPHNNKKYISALKNVINFQSQDSLGASTPYGSLGSEEVNMICIPGIFYGSSIEKGSIELEYYVNGATAARAIDKFKDGRLFQVQGPEEFNDTQVGLAIYNYGTIILTSSSPLHPSVEENYYSSDEHSTTSPSWTNFGTGIPQVGEILEHGPVPNSSYSVKFKGINKIPTLTMFAYSELGKDNYSSNPTFTELASGEHVLTSNGFSEPEILNHKTNKSDYADHEDDYASVTYISKIGIYDKYKNLIAVATLANPVKKTEKRDFMFKLGLDF